MVVQVLFSDARVALHSARIAARPVVKHDGVSTTMILLFKLGQIHTMVVWHEKSLQTPQQTPWAAEVVIEKAT